MEWDTFYQSIDSEDWRSRCLERMPKLDLKRGETLYRAGDRPRGVYLIEIGLVGVVMPSANGTEHLLRLYRPGQMLGHRSLLAAGEHHATATALEDSRLAFVPKERLVELWRKEDAVSLAIAAQLAKELGHAEDRLIARTDRSAVARIAEALVYLLDLYPHHAWTRREIGEFCGATTATVIRTLTRFEKLGLVGREGRRLKILQRERLLAEL